MTRDVLAGVVGVAGVLSVAVGGIPMATSPAALTLAPAARLQLAPDFCTSGGLMAVRLARRSSAPTVDVSFSADANAVSVNVVPGAT